MTLENILKLFVFLTNCPAYRGKPQAEKLFYMFSQSYYKTKQYTLAGYQFESFVSGYPKVKT
jgi:outer membrane protein assembly factor BamD